MSRRAMGRDRVRIAVAAVLTASLGLSACAATVPSFRLAPQGGAPGVSAKQSLVTVTEIRDHIYCELKAAQVPDNTAVTVALSLQVDDSFDVTPSLSYTQLLHAPRVSVVTSLGADLGRARKRVFTATYSLDSTQMNKGAAGAPSCHGLFLQRGADLRGDLGVAEIVADGRLTSERPAAPASMPGLLVAPDGNSKFGPTYAGQVQFVITRQVGAFGPVWTLHHWKGGGGGNGLVNGKRLDTDGVILTFAAAAPPKLPNPLIQAAAKSARDRSDKLAKEARDRRALASRAAATAELLVAPQTLQALPRSARQAAALRAEQARTTAQAAETAAQIAEAEAQLAETRAEIKAEQAAADLAAAEQSGSANMAAAAEASREQLNTILLQNLASQAAR